MKKEISHDSLGIANYILNQASKFGINKITPMKLLKLIYISHGWSCVVNDVPLVNTLPYAWKYGPVYPEVYNKLEQYVGEHINHPITNKKGEIYTAPLSESQEELLTCIIKNYGKLYASQLSNMTHQEGSPWYITIKTTGYLTPIPLEIIRMYYRGKARQLN